MIFAQVFDGHAHNPCVNPQECFTEEWILDEANAGHPFSQVPDGTKHGAIDNGDGTFTNPPDPSTIPNNPGNPYFGKKPLPVDEFRALVGQILPPVRYKRLTRDAGFLWIQDMIQSPTFQTVDTDDKKGEFIKLVGYLLTTDAEDGQKLMTTVERDAILNAWPKA